MSEATAILIQDNRNSLTPQPPKNEEDIAAWLYKFGLSIYSDSFIKEGITVAALPYLEESHLIELKLSLGDRLKLKMALAGREVASSKSSPMGSPALPSNIKTDATKRESPNPSPLPTTSQKSASFHVKRPSDAAESKNSTPTLSSSFSSSSSIPKRNSTLPPNMSQPNVAKLDKNKSVSMLVAPVKKTGPTLDVPIPMPLAVNEDVEEFQCKVVVIGPPATGKTSLVRRYTQGTFERGYKQTIGVDFEVKTVQWSDNIVIHVQLWDIAGQERFSAVVPQFYRSAAAALVVYDITDESTLQAALKWNEHLQKHEILPSGKSVPVMLLANKCDLLSEDKPLPNLDEVCKENKIVKWWLTSAKTNAGISDAVNFLVNTILTESGVDTELAAKKNEKTVHLGKSKKPVAKQDGQCCF